MSSTPTSLPAACPFLSADAYRPDAVGSGALQRWWPNQLNLRVLRQEDPTASPFAPPSHERFEDHGYAEAFATVDLDELKADLVEMMHTSQPWWPADYGHYGPLMIRMAWHASGTYRIHDGRGGSGAGMLRFAPLNSWPDNANLDKARRLLWPIKQKYGERLSWGDLMIYAGTCAIEDMGLPSFGFGGGRVDRWEPEEDVYWGPENEWLGDNRYSGDRVLETSLGAVQMGLIYVNPEGPNGNPDPAASARDIRETFGRMAMDDEETVALIAGGHTFGKAHGAGDAGLYVDHEPEGAGLEHQGLGWKNRLGRGHGADTITSGLEGAWTAQPTRWDNGYFHNLMTLDWELTVGPGGAKQWTPTDKTVRNVPDAHDPNRRHAPMMFTTDLALKVDPAYRVISERFHRDPGAFGDAFARAWYKLTHRDLGPQVRLLGDRVAEPQLWQDPVPEATGEPITADDAAELKRRVLASGVRPEDLIFVAWSAASSFRGTDKRGGVNGARLRLSPQKDWAANEPDRLRPVLDALEKIQLGFNAEQARGGGGRVVSLADLIVLAGNAAVEQAAAKGGHDLEVGFRPGRTDADAASTDAASFDVLEPTADGFRNYLHPDHTRPAEQLLVDKANLLTLTPVEMTVLVGGLRSMNVTHADTGLGVLTDRPGVLSNDVFRNLLDNRLMWHVSERCEHFYEGYNESGNVRWRCTAADLVFGSNSLLRSLAEVYAADDAEGRFVRAFASVWQRVMELDRFDLHR